MLSKLSPALQIILTLQHSVCYFFPCPREPKGSRADALRSLLFLAGKFCATPEVFKQKTLDIFAI